MSDTEIKALPPRGRFLVSTEHSVACWDAVFKSIRIDVLPEGRRRLVVNDGRDGGVFDLDRDAANHLSRLLASSEVTVTGVDVQADAVLQETRTFQDDAAERSDAL